MKHFKVAGIILLVLVSLAACSRVPPGYVGVKVSLLGDERGGMEVLQTGRYYIGAYHELHRFPTFNQNYVWTQNVAEGSPTDESFTFPIDGLTVGLDVGIEYSLEADRVSEIFTRYRRGVDELTDVTIRNQVRDAINRLASGYDMDRLVEEGAEELVRTAFIEVRDYFAPQGIIIHSLSLVSAPRYPATVVSAIEAKIEATQRAVQRENELREAQAEAAKRVAEAEGTAQALIIAAQSEAEANALRTRSLSDAVLRMEWINKWDGRLPEFVSDVDGLIIQPGR